MGLGPECVPLEDYKMYSIMICSEEGLFQNVNLRIENAVIHTSFIHAHIFGMVFVLIIIKVSQVPANDLNIK